MASLRFQVYDWNKSGKNEFIGEFTTNLKALVEHAASKVPFQLVTLKKTTNRGYKNSGMFFVTKCKVESRWSFLDYRRQVRERAPCFCCCAVELSSLGSLCVLCFGRRGL